MKAFFGITFIILIFFLIFRLSPFLINIDKGNFSNGEEFSKALVTEILKSDSQNAQKVKVTVEEGIYKGKEFIIDNNLVVRDNLLSLKKNDQVLLSIKGSDKEKLDITIYQYVREKNYYT